MNIGELISIKTLEDEQDFYGSKEKHTPYCAEIRLFSCVQQGDLKKLMAELQNIDSSIITGKMSDNGLMQYKYMAVSAITLATRYAIQGGLNEKTAYAFSDRVIRLVDGFELKADVLLCLASEIIKLTRMVKKSKTHPEHSPHVRRCVRHINENLGGKLTVSALADICGISPDYLSQVFKEEMGEAPSVYITRKKLESAKDMLAQNKSSCEIALALGFSSQSHFITVFKRLYGMTPLQYVKLTK